MYVNPLPKNVFKGWPRLGSGLGFGYQRSARHVHQGVDLSAPVGTPVMAMTDGVVVRAQTSLSPSMGKGTGPGLHLVIRYPGNIWSWYQHLSEVLVRLGEKVRAGQVVAYSGKTMYSDKSTVPHLHFEVLTKYPPGKEPEGGGIQHRVNPQKFLESQGAILQGTPTRTRTGLGVMLGLGAALLFVVSKRGGRHG